VLVDIDTEADLLLARAAQNDTAPLPHHAANG
jgi:hypothetical protein